MTSNRLSNRGPVGPIYESFVSSVFSDPKVLIFGLIPSVFAVGVTAYITGSIYLYILTAICGIVGLARVWITHSFHAAKKAGKLTIKDYQKWDLRHTICAVIHASAFASWFLISVFLDSRISEFISITIVFGNLIGICSRSFPITRLVDAQIVAVSVPLFSGLLYKGGVYLVLAATLLPYMVSLRSLAARQRENLLNNVVNRRKAEHLAGQFNDALENVPQGICMFDAAGNLEVANQHIGHVLGRSMKSIQRTTVMQMVELLDDEMKLPKARISELKEWLIRSDQPPIGFSFEIGRTNKKTLKFRASRMDNGGIIATFEDVTREIKAANQIEYMVRFDRLTGLMNRNQLPGQLEAKLDRLGDDEKCAVLVININRFKQINDTLGHAYGDILLCRAADRLKDLCGEDYLCARFAGDEFAVVLSGTNALDMAIHFADVVADEFSKPFLVEHHKISLNCSIGIALNEGRFESADEVLRHADLALLWARKDGTGEWRVYNAEMSRELEQTRLLEADLRNALENNEFEAFFQPIVNLKEARVSVCEALLRWKHPRRGFVSPAKFVPIAEDLGLIDKIGSWMLNEACAACAQWPNGTRVAVNLSPVQFKSGDLAKTVENALRSSGLEPNRLELEITESLMLEDVVETISLLNRLKKTGVRISLDDFGTGYSSLNYMNELPLDKVKIDRSFVLELQEKSKSLTMVQAISGLSRNLGLTVVVEGIETPRQLSMLCRNAQVDEIQGYLFSKPVDGATIMSLLDRSSMASKKMLSNVKPNAILAA